MQDDEGDEGPGFSFREPDTGNDSASEEKPRRGRGGKDKAPGRNRRDELALLLFDVDLWRSPDGTPYASVPYATHRECLKIDGRGFRSWVLLRWYLQHGTGLSGQAMASIVALAEARALSSGEVRRPWRRTAWHDGAVYFDLGGGNPSGERRAVKITEAGWDILDAAAVPVAFLRSPDALPLPEPLADEAKPEDLLRFCNVADPDDLVLVWAFIACSLRPFIDRGAYPILLLHGEQGCGKTAFSRVLQGLIDPTTMQGRSIPREERDLFVGAQNRHFLVFDNLSNIGDVFADCFCRLSTGGGFSARSLHTDSDETTFNLCRPIMMNGIPSGLLGRPDLADRSIVVELKPLEERRPETELAADFERLQPGLLGLICDALSSALRNLGTTRLEDPPRMIDAAMWAEAAAQGLGFEKGRLASVWSRNRRSSDRDALAVDDVALSVLKLLSENISWTGSPTELYNELTRLAGEKAAASKLWPRSASGLGAKLRRIAPALRSVHRINAVASKGGSDSTRSWQLWKLLP